MKTYQNAITQDPIEVVAIVRIPGYAGVAPGQEISPGVMMGKMANCAGAETRPRMAMDIAIANDTELPAE
jgi:hypothetical protein